MIKQFNSGQEINDYIDARILGSFLVSDIDFLGTYVKQLQPKDKYLEIGTSYGKSIASAIFQAPDGIEFYTCDIEDSQPYIHGSQSRLGRKDFFTSEKLDSVCYFIQKDRLEVAKMFPKEYFSMIFIDGIHTYEDGKADIAAFTPLLKSGGFMVFHDYSDPQFTLWRAIDECVRDSDQFTDFKVAKSLGYGISSIAGAKKV